MFAERRCFYKLIFQVKNKFDMKTRLFTVGFGIVVLLFFDASTALALPALQWEVKHSAPIAGEKDTMVPNSTAVDSRTGLVYVVGTSFHVQPTANNYYDMRISSAAWVIGRYHSEDGSLDTSWGKNGYMFYAPYAGNNQAFDVAVDGLGNVYVVGVEEITYGDDAYRLKKYDEYGTPACSSLPYNPNVYRQSLYPSDQAYTVVVDRDGQFVYVGGRAEGKDSIVKYNASNCSQVATFGSEFSHVFEMEQGTSGMLYAVGTLSGGTFSGYRKYTTAGVLITSDASDVIVSPDNYGACYFPHCNNIVANEGAISDVLNNNIAARTDFWDFALQTVKGFAYGVMRSGGELAEGRDFIQIYNLKTGVRTSDKVKLGLSFNPFYNLRLGAFISLGNNLTYYAAGFLREPPGVSLSQQSRSIVVAKFEENEPPGLIPGGSGFSFSDDPDPVDAGNPVNLRYNWTDPDTDQGRVHFCRTNEIIPSRDGGRCVGDTLARSDIAPPGEGAMQYMTRGTDAPIINYYVFACDVRALCSENVNNSGTITVVARPNLRVPNAPAVPSNAAQGSTVTLSGTVLNSGIGSVASDKTFQNTFEIDRNNDGIKDEGASGSISERLAAGASKLVSASWTPVQQGNGFRLRLCADQPGNVVNDETNETDNCSQWSGTFNVALPQRPNLTVTIPATSSSRTEGSPVFFSSVVRNIVNASASAPASSASPIKTEFKVDLNSSVYQTDDVIRAAQNITNPIATGEQANVSSINSWTAVAGTHTVRVCTDISGVVTEFSESDNCTNGASDFVMEISAEPKPQCSDSVDNDGDGKIDYPIDPGCFNADDDDEFNAPIPACSDGLDNDYDGRIDLNDPGCSEPDDDDETDLPQCSDGLDNDGDGKIDYSIDPGCDNPNDNNEGDDPECSDGIDNDGDGQTDYPNDPECENDRDTDEEDRRPDLLISRVPRIYSGEPEAGASITFSADVKNASDIAVSPTNAIFYIDYNNDGSINRQVSTHSVPALNAQASSTVISGTWTAIMGTHRVIICADDNVSSPIVVPPTDIGDVVEMSESNNCSTANGGAVRGRDLIEIAGVSRE